MLEPEQDRVNKTPGLPRKLRQAWLEDPRYIFLLFIIKLPIIVRYLVVYFQQGPFCNY